MRRRTLTRRSRETRLKFHVRETAEFYVMNYTQTKLLRLLLRSIMCAYAYARCFALSRIYTSHF